MEILEHQRKALLIYKKIQLYKKELFNRIKKQGLFDEFEKMLNELLRKEKIDQKTAYLLSRLLGKNREETVNDPVFLAAETAVNNLIDELAMLENYPKKDRTLLTLSPEGDLYREPKEKYCYPMRKEKNRLKTLRSLTKKYKDTQAIQIETESINTATVRKAIGEINRKAKSLLKLKKNLIESKPYSGYRISHFYRLIRK